MGIMWGLLILVFGLFQIGGAKGVVILKLDDFEFRPNREGPGVLQGWVDTYQFLKEQNVVAGYGVIAEYLGDATDEHLQFVEEILDQGFEIWHHGWDHDKDGANGEFCGHPMERQGRHFHDALNIVEEKYGLTMRSFGSPYNCSDSILTRVFEGQEKVKVFMYPNKPAPRNAFALERSVNMENGTGNPDFEYFLESYNSNKGRDYYVLQGHPATWSNGSERLEEFKMIIEFLKEEGMTFMTPYGYYLDLQETTSILPTASFRDIQNPSKEYSIKGEVLPRIPKSPRIYIIGH